MRIFSYVLSFAYTATLVAALPAETISDSELQRRDELADALRSAKSQFPAIWWDDAAETCSLERFKILVESTRMAAELASWDMWAWGTSAWDVFFQNDPQWERGYTGLYFNLRSTMRGAPSWVFKKPSKNKRQYHVIYRCGNPAEYTNCNNLGTAAYTITPGEESGRTRFANCPFCTMVVFCPWNFIGPGAQYLNAVTAGEKKSPSQLKDLSTYEHTTLHEWFHVAKTRFGSPKMGSITDVEAVIYDGKGMEKVYGPRKSEDFAWQIPGSLNSQVALNADTYAWYYTYRWFEKAWGWPEWKRGDTGSPPSRRRKSIDGRSLSERQESDETVRGSKDIPAPPLCKSDEKCDLPPDGTYYSTENCLLSEPCRNGLDDGSFDPECECSCDGTILDVNDPRCVSLIGPRPPPTTPGVKTCAASSDCGTGCCDTQSKICSTPENSTCM